MNAIFQVQGFVYDALFILVLVLCLVALVDLLRRPGRAFVDAGKRTKGFWGAILGVATAVAFIAVPPFGAPIMLLVIGAAVASVVYLVDVRPAVAPYSGRGGRGPSRGGW